MSGSRKSTFCSFVKSCSFSSLPPSAVSIASIKSLSVTSPTEPRSTTSVTPRVHIFSSLLHTVIGPRQRADLSTVFTDYNRISAADFSHYCFPRQGHRFLLRVHVPSRLGRTDKRKIQRRSMLVLKSAYMWDSASIDPNSGG